MKVAKACNGAGLIGYASIKGSTAIPDPMPWIFSRHCQSDQRQLRVAHADHGDLVQRLEEAGLFVQLRH